MFEGFALERVDVGDVTLRVRHGGSGPPLLLVHGHPRTHTTWYRVAPRLTERFTVVCPDTRGYGESTKPPTDENHTPYSKRAMAADCVALMRHLGHERFFVAGHDRGAYVATRLALDHPEVVRGAAILDAVPIAEALDRCDARFAREWYHWFFFAQPEKPERVITADPDAWYDVGTRNTPARLGEENFADFRRAIHDPATVTAMLEDYRAGLGVDRAHDDADRAAGRRITCPALVLWSSDDDMADLYGDVLAVWRPWTTDLRGHAIASGHHVAEENPEALAAALSEFFGAVQR
ncbi:alpha/beta fold hydrolase [Amycolatopsis rifamycinica]|uniref:Alpha/beta hydrolase n=1 Tax=Amycolatopsis rifamycinica TaxID=287986 RepID=A0A066U199_9PSEU|nr:alpha/beta hydrolase [Amycolatopsis rifamycinica]KDN19632.1 alpha/beta hydrolase [Amycolatopsis rifamycinica]